MGANSVADKQGEIFSPSEAFQLAARLTSGFRRFFRSSDIVPRRNELTSDVSGTNNPIHTSVIEYQTSRRDRLSEVPTTGLHLDRTIHRIISGRPSNSGSHFARFFNSAR